MYFSGITDPSQAAVMTGVLNEHCRQHGIAWSDKARDAAAQRLVALFKSGMRRAEDYRFLMANQ